MDQRPPEGESPTVRLSSDAAALVNPNYVWKRISPTTPRSAKLLLINEEAGVLTHGVLGSNTWFTHYCECPVFSDYDG